MNKVIKSSIFLSWRNCSNKEFYIRPSDQKISSIHSPSFGCLVARNTKKGSTEKIKSHRQNENLWNNVSMKKHENYLNGFFLCFPMQWAIIKAITFHNVQPWSTVEAIVSLSLIQYFFSVLLLKLLMNINFGSTFSEGFGY